MITATMSDYWSAERVDRVLIALVLPMLLLSVALNQPRAFPWLGAAGQLISIAGTGIVIAIVARALPFRLWPLVLTGILLIARGARLMVGDADRLVLAYTILASILYAAAGAYVSQTRPEVLRRQFVFLCAVSVPIMIGQILGVDFLQLLRTDIESNATPGLHPTFRVPAEQIVMVGLQARPAGLMYANNVLAIIVLLGLGLHFGRVDRTKLSGGDIAVLAVVVLLMAKITFLGLGVVLAIRLFWGRAARVHTVRCVIAFAALLWLYRLAFPGLFALNLSLQLLITNFETRFADLLLATGSPALAEWTQRFPPSILTKLNTTGASQSGYAALAQRARTFVPTLIVSLPYFWMAARTLWQLDRDDRREILSLGVMFCLVPLISPYFGSLLLWFLVGGALRPVWALVNSGLVAVPERVQGARR